MKITATWGVVLAGLILALPAWAGSFTASTSATQDAAIQRKVDQINARIARTNPTAARYTRDMYLAERWNELLEGLVSEWRESMPSLAERWKTMPDADRAEVCRRLGVAECPK